MLALYRADWTGKGTLYSRGMAIVLAESPEQAIRFCNGADLIYFDSERWEPPVKLEKISAVTGIPGVIAYTSYRE